MTGEERRNQIVETIKNSTAPVAGVRLAEKYQVSRQVIVQDIALLRAAGYDILSTNRGYYIRQEKKMTRVFKVSHTDEEMEDELNTIVDLGGKVLDVYINHKVYGKIRAELNISSRRQVQEFLETIYSGKSSPLKNITSNYHYHTIEADSEKTFELIEQSLKEKNYLIV
ncbi:MAG: transcription repressor NadR [Lachnospiraceae bacterium]|nr:transcription repressor NadR [Lachnospiraceae bacterium]